MLIIGLTGPSGAGKGVVGAVLASHGIPSIDTDRVYHKLLVPPSACLDALVDRFGKDVMLVPDGEEHFNFTAKVAVSPMFLSWVIGFGNKARILYPESVVERCRNMCLEALEQYQEKA